MSDNCNSNCSSCEKNCADRKQDMRVAANEHSNVKKVIGIVSGKGGVGKSLVTSLMASKIQKQGYQSAIIDGDITGPSIPKIFGVHQKAYANEQGIVPVQSDAGTKLMSINLLLDNETDPVVWRGPIIAGYVSQFWSEVAWGDVDYMFVDMPPGTGDVPLTVFQSLPLDGIIVVTSPQELVKMIVQKAVKMADMMNVPVLGVVENMSYFECPDCKKIHKIFGESHIEEMCEEFGIDTLARIPINPQIAKTCDTGEIESLDVDWIDALISKVKLL